MTELAPLPEAAVFCSFFRALKNGGCRAYSVVERLRLAGLRVPRG